MSSDLIKQGLRESWEVRIERDFTYHTLEGRNLRKSTKIREEAKELALLISELPPSREQSLAITKLEEALSCVDLAIIREGL